MSEHDKLISQIKIDHNLTWKQASFVYYFAGNSADACRQAGYQGTNQVLSVTGSRLLASDKIQTALAARTASQDDTIMGPDDLMAYWSDIVADQTGKYTTMDKHKASESLARSMAMFTDKSISLNYNKSDRIDQLTDAELNELLSQTIKQLLDHKVISPDQLVIEHDDQ